MSDRPLGHCGLDNQCVQWDGQQDGLLTIMNDGIVATNGNSVVTRGGDGIVIVSRGHHIGGSV
jgi:hypothetical protein